MHPSTQTKQPSLTPSQNKNSLNYGNLSAHDQLEDLSTVVPLCIKVTFKEQKFLKGEGIPLLRPLHQDNTCMRAQRKVTLQVQYACAQFTLTLWAAGGSGIHHRYNPPQVQYECAQSTLTVVCGLSYIQCMLSCIQIKPFSGTIYLRSLVEMI